MINILDLVLVTFHVNKPYFIFGNIGGGGERNESFPPTFSRSQGSVLVLTVRVTWGEGVDMSVTCDMMVLTDRTSEEREK